MDSVQGLTDLQLWLLIIGFVGPLVIAFVSRPTLTPLVKILIQTAYSMITGAGTAYLSGQFNGRTILSAFLLIFAVTVISYKGLWKPAGTADAIESGVLAGDTDTAVADGIPEAEDTNPQDITDVDDNGTVTQ